MEKTFYNSKGKLAGRLVDGIYRKKVVRSKHLMRMFNGYGIDNHIVEELEKENCKEIRILETDTGVVWHTALKDFVENMIKKSFDGLQCFLPNKYWQQDNPKQKSLL